MIRSCNFSELGLTELLNEEGFVCACGKYHHTDVKDIIIGHGVLNQIPEQVRKHGGSKPFLLADKNTYRAAGQRVASILEERAFPSLIIFILRNTWNPTSIPWGRLL